MKNQETLQIEMMTLNSLIDCQKHDEADTVVTRMLSDYNPFDYELLTKRAILRQSQGKDQEAIKDAHIALGILPQRLEAYEILFKSYHKLNKVKETFKILEILKTAKRDDEDLKNLYDDLKLKHDKQT